MCTVLSENHFGLYGCVCLYAINFKKCKDLALTWKIMNNSFYVIQITFWDFRKYLVIDKKKSCFGKNGGNLMSISVAMISFFFFFNLFEFEM